MFRDLGAGVDPRRRKPASTTFGATLTAIWGRTTSHPGPRLYSDLVNRHLGDWLNIPLQNISREMVEARHLAIPGRATGNGTMRVLRAVFNYAADRDATLPPNPVRLKRQWHKVRPRERVISSDQMPSFYKAVIGLERPIGRDYLLLTLFTGLRRREAAGLRWSEVDLAGGTLTIPAARNKAGRKFDLPLTTSSTTCW